MTPPARASLALAGTLGLLPLLPALVVFASNPWFMDDPRAFLLLLVLPLATVGAGLGLLLGRRLARLPAPLAVGLAAAALVGPYGLAMAPRPAPLDDVRLLVLGVDGATFQVMDRLDLPAFRALQEEGARADLISMEPMFSPLLWTTMSTGRRPEAHGIHGFRVHATDCRAARFWEPMQAAGLRVGVYKWLVTWPPQEARGFMVPAWLAPTPETWPPDLSFVKELELSRRLDRKRVQTRRSTVALAWDGARHGLRISTLVAAARYSVVERLSGPDPRRARIDGQILRVWMDRDVFVWALHAYRPDVATITDYATDSIQHHAWDDWADQGTGAIPAAYRQADALLAELRREAPSARVVVVSDHGFEALPAGGEAEFAAPRTETLRVLAEAAVGPVEASRLGHKVVLTPLGGEPEAARAGIEAFVAGLVRASTGRPLFRVEPVPDDPRSLGLTLADGAFPDAALASDTVAGRPLSDFVARTEAWSGVHGWRGVFLAAGPGIAPGARLPDLSLVDVAPILVTLAGVPPALDLEGRVPDGLLVEPADLPAAPASWDDLAGRVRPWVSVEQGAGVNEEQLRALGYVE